MKIKQRNRLLKRRQEHGRIQQIRKKMALQSATLDAKHQGKHGPLKNPRTGEAFVKAMRDCMQARGYLPAPKGRWRRMTKYEHQIVYKVVS